MPTSIAKLQAHVVLASELPPCRAAAAPEPPAEERYVCEGGYLDVAGDAVARISAPDPVTVSGDGDGQGRVALGPTTTRVALRWNADAFHFEAP